MMHKIIIRDLNTFGNQLPHHTKLRKDIHAAVLVAVQRKAPYVFFDDAVPWEAKVIEGIAAAKILEKEGNKAKRTISNQTPYMSVQEYILRGGR